MKKLKKFICAILALILLVSNSGIEAFAQTIAWSALTGGADPGSAPYGIRGNAYGYRIGLSSTGGKMPDGNYAGIDIPEKGDMKPAKYRDTIRGVIEEYVNNNVPFLNAKESMYVQISGPNYTNYKVARGDGSSKIEPSYITYKAATNNIHTDKNPFTDLVSKWNPYEADTSDITNISSLLKAIQDANGGKSKCTFPTKAECRASIVKLVDSDTNIPKSLQNWIQSKADNPRDRYNGALAGFLTVYFACDKPDKYATRLLKYLKYTDGQEHKDVQYPVILIERVNCYYAPDGCFWASTAQYFAKAMGVNWKTIMYYGNSLGKKYPISEGGATGNIKKMWYYLHEYNYDWKVKEESNRIKHISKRNCCSGSKEAWPKICTKRLYMQHQNCGATKWKDFFTTYTGVYGGHQGEGVRAGENMLGICYAYGAGDAKLQVPPEGKFKWKLSEKDTVDAKSKNYCDSNLKMKDHKLDITNISIKQTSEKYKIWSQYLKENKDEKVYIKFEVRHKESKKSIKNSKHKNVIKGTQTPETTSLITKSTGKVKSGSKSFKVNEYYELSISSLKNYLNPDKTTQNFTISSDYITADLSGGKRAAFAYAMKCIVKVGNVEIELGNKDVKKVTYFAESTPPPPPIGPEPLSYSSTYKTPYAEVKCGTVTDSGSQEPFEAMAGFPTTEDIYFASGGTEYVVQLTYILRKEKSSKRAYTQPSSTATSSLTIPYTVVKGAQDSADPGSPPADLTATCPECGAKVSTHWFAVRVAETRWDWKETATVPSHVTGQDSEGNNITCGGASATETTSDSATPGPDVVATCSCGTESSRAQKKVRATRWNWEWRNYGHANTHTTSDSETGLPYTNDKKTFPNTRTETKTSTLNGLHKNTNTTVSNASETITMNNINKNGVISHTTSWDQAITDFNYAEITDCKVWKLSEARLDGTTILTETDEIKATIKSQDTSFLYNRGEGDTAKSGRLWHDQKPEDQDEYKFETFNPSGYCENCVEYKAGKDLVAKSVNSLYDNPTCISDYLILRTTKGDLSLLYFEYDANNKTVPVATVNNTGSKKGGSYTITSKPVTFKSQNDKATEELVCKGKKTFKGINLKPDDITYGGYNGNFKSVDTKYISSAGFTENINIDSLKINKTTYSKYKATQRPSTVLKLVANTDVPDIIVQNGPYSFSGSSVFYENVINYGSEDADYDIEVQPDYNNKKGFVLETTYSPEHTSINSVVVHNPVSVQEAILIPLDDSRDQRTQSSLIEDPYKNNNPGSCTGDSSTCPYSHLHCEYNDKTYHTKDCYEYIEREYDSGIAFPETPKPKVDTYRATSGLILENNATLFGDYAELEYSEDVVTPYLAFDKNQTIYITVSGINVDNGSLQLYTNRRHKYIYCQRVKSSSNEALYKVTIPSDLEEINGLGNPYSLFEFMFVVTGYGNTSYVDSISIEKEGACDGFYTSSKSITLKAGTYRVEAHASGNSCGYTKGTITLSSPETIDIEIEDGITKVYTYKDGTKALAMEAKPENSKKYYWKHSSSCEYSNETHISTSTDCCSQCGHNCGYMEGPVSIPLVERCKIYDSRFTDTSTGVTSSNKARVVIVKAQVSTQKVKERVLSCNEPHHSANSNWHYYIDGWEDKDGNIIDGTYSGTADIRPKGSKVWYKPTSIPSKLVLVQVDGEYMLTAASKPDVDLVTGKQLTLDTYTTDGVTYKKCIWPLTNTDGPTVDTVNAKASYYHHSFGNDICWDPCNNDAYHKDSVTVNVNGQPYSESGEFLNLDYGFQIYFPNIGYFAGTNAYGIADISNVPGKGYTSPMDTTKWVKSKYIVFDFDVIYDKNGDGDFSNDKLYLAGTPVYLGDFVASPDGRSGTFYDHSPTDNLYNFYIPLEVDEAYSSGIYVYAVADNASGDNWSDNESSHNYDREDFIAKHDASKEIRVDLVGRIGGLTMLDTGDFRYANLFKETKSDWLIDNIVKKVDPNRQNYFLADKYTIRGELASASTNGLNTYGTQSYKNDITKRLDFPLTPMSNNIQSLQKQPQRIGYLNYLSLETLGNYYGENISPNTDYKVQITPYYYHLDLATGQWSPVDVYMLVGNQYKRIYKYGNTGPTAEHEWFYSLNWQEESARRQYTQLEKNSTDSVVNYFTLPEAVGETQVNRKILVPSGKECIFGTAQRLFLKDRNRTFIGASLSESINTNPEDKVDEEKYMRNGQRWHFTLGLPSSAVFVKAGESCTTENINEICNSHGVVVCAIDVLAKGTSWTLKYDGVPHTEQKLQILPTGATYDYSGDPNGPSDKPIVNIYSTDKSSKQDLNVQGTH